MNIYQLLKVGRWLKARHPEVLSPADLTQDIAVEFVAAVNEMKIGEWTQVRHRSQGVTVEQLIGDVPEQYRNTVRITVLHFALLALLKAECSAGMITEEQHNELTTYLSHLERLASLAP